MSKKKPAKNRPGIWLPWYAYLFIILVYVSPFLMLTPLALITDLFTTEEFGVIFAHPLINAITIITFIAAFGMAFWERKFLSQYVDTPECRKSINKKIKDSSAWKHCNSNYFAGCSGYSN